MSFHVLIACTHDSARSVLAGATLGHSARRLGRPVVAPLDRAALQAALAEIGNS